MKRQHLFAAILVVVLLFVPLALPYRFGFSYWAESVVVWIASILVGAIAAIYVLYIFLEIRHELVQETEDEQEVQP